jgi:group I intron endonuclease
MFVYLVTNKVNGKKYVGQHAGNDLESYWRRNVWLAEMGYEGKRLLYRAIRKYGEDGFDVKPLVIVGTKEEMDRYEIGLIKAWDLTNPEKGYNITLGGGGSLGVKFSKETRAKMSKAREGKTMSEENRLKFIERIKGNKFALGRKMSKEHLDKIIATHLGAKRSDEAKRRMSEAHLGKTQSEETKKKRANANRGQKRSEESKRRISEALKGNATASHVRWHVSRGITNPECKLCQETINGYR